MPTPSERVGHDHHDPTRSFICGMIWPDADSTHELPHGAFAVSTRQLCTLINRCKSNVNAGFQALAYVTVPIQPRFCESCHRSAETRKMCRDLLDSPRHLALLGRSKLPLWDVSKPVLTVMTTSGRQGSPQMHPGADRSVLNSSAQKDAGHINAARLEGSSCAPDSSERVHWQAKLHPRD
jgi:hypothetical protein